MWVAADARASRSSIGREAIEENPGGKTRPFDSNNAWLDQVFERLVGFAPMIPNA
jgi:hypothetical protein